MESRTGPTVGPGESPAGDPKEVSVVTMLEGDTIFQNLFLLMLKMPYRKAIW